MTLRVWDRCVQWQNPDSGAWVTLKTFRTADAARRGLALRKRNPAIAVRDMFRFADETISKKLGKRWRRGSWKL